MQNQRIVGFGYLTSLVQKSEHAGMGTEIFDSIVFRSKTSFD